MNKDDDKGESVLTAVLGGASVREALSSLSPICRLEFVQNAINKERLKSAIYLRNLERFDERSAILEEVRKEISMLDKEVNGFLAAPLVAIAKEEVRVIESDLKAVNKNIDDIQVKENEEGDFMILQQDLFDVFNND